jgi:hypothetical protein
MDVSDPLEDLVPFPEPQPASQGEKPASDGTEKSTSVMSGGCSMCGSGPRLAWIVAGHLASYLAAGR